MKEDLALMAWMNHKIKEMCGELDAGGYVPRFIAEPLAEVGYPQDFDKETVSFHFYRPDDDTLRTYVNIDGFTRLPEGVVAPTFSEVIRWLWKEKKIFVGVSRYRLKENTYMGEVSEKTRNGWSDILHGIWESPDDFFWAAVLKSVDYLVKNKKA